MPDTALSEQEVKKIVSGLERLKRLTLTLAISVFFTGFSLGALVVKLTSTVCK